MGNEPKVEEQAKQIFIDLNNEMDSITKDAQSKGIWRAGLDSNDYLFEEAIARAKERLAALDDPNNNNR